MQSDDTGVNNACCPPRLAQRRRPFRVSTLANVLEPHRALQQLVWRQPHFSPGAGPELPRDGVPIRDDVARMERVHSGAIICRTGWHFRRQPARDGVVAASTMRSWVARRPCTGACCENSAATGVPNPSRPTLEPLRRCVFLSIPTREGNVVNTSCQLMFRPSGGSHALAGLQVFFCPWRRTLAPPRTLPI